MTIVYIFLAILILMFMITVHELGHYLAGKWLGFRINEFSIGFGKALYKRQSKKTGEVFAIRMIPLGGYCAFEGEDAAGSGGHDAGKSEVREREDEGTLEENAYAKHEDKKREDEFPDAKGVPFNQAPPWKRLIVLFSGGFANFICAIIFCVVLMMVFGYYQGVGFGSISDNSPNAPGEGVAVHERLMEGDILVGIDGERFTLLNGFSQVMGRINVPRGETREVEFTVLRNDQERTIVGYVIHDQVRNADGDLEWRIMIGVYHAESVYLREGFFSALWRGFLFSFELAWVILEFLWMLITGQLGLSGIGGPGATISVISEAVGNNLINILLLVPLISVNLAVFNLLPIPALDGARMVFVGIEWARGKPVNPEIEGRIHLVGLLLLFTLVILADLNWFFF
ncbi:MAG: site-2 protease family protein [Firmicutes bacterium]|nr:site-2 protease family protein [Bacillota bacterium]